MDLLPTRYPFTSQIFIDKKHCLAGLSPAEQCADEQIRYSSDLRSGEQADGTVPSGVAHPHLVNEDLCCLPGRAISLADYIVD